MYASDSAYLQGVAGLLRGIGFQEKSLTRTEDNAFTQIQCNVMQCDENVMQYDVKVM